MGSPPGPERSRQRDRSSFRVQRSGLDGEWADLPEWITVEEAAQQSGYHPEYVRRLARQGRIGASKKGRDWWVDRDVLRAYLEAMIALGSRRHDPTAPWKRQAQETAEAGEVG